MPSLFPTFPASNIHYFLLFHEINDLTFHKRLGAWSVCLSMPDLLLNLMPSNSTSLPRITGLHSLHGWIIVHHMCMCYILFTDSMDTLVDSMSWNSISFNNTELENSLLRGSSYAGRVSSSIYGLYPLDARCQYLPPPIRGSSGAKSPQVENGGSK